MEVIKKKMQMMKMERDAALNRTSEYEKIVKSATLRSESAETEWAAAERKVKLLESEASRWECRAEVVTREFKEVTTLYDESQRKIQSLADQTLREDGRVAQLEKVLLESNGERDELSKRYEEALRKSQLMEKEVERVMGRLRTAETKVISLEEELRSLGSQMKSVAVSKKQVSAIEEGYSLQIKTLTAAKLATETEAETSERSVKKLKKELEKLEDRLRSERKKTKMLQDDMDATLNDIENM